MSFDRTIQALENAKAQQDDKSRTEVAQALLGLLGDEINKKAGKIKPNDIEEKLSRINQREVSDLFPSNALPPGKVLADAKPIEQSLEERLNETTICLHAAGGRIEENRKEREKYAEEIEKLNKKMAALDKDYPALCKEYDDLSNEVQELAHQLGKVNKRGCSIS